MAVAIDNKSAAIVAKYRTLFDVKEQQLNGQKNHPLQAIRRQAMDRLEDIGFPARKDEDYKYTYVTKIVKEVFAEGKGATIGKNVAEAAGFPEMDAYRLVFVNGVLNTELSDTTNQISGLTISDLKTAYDNAATQSLVEKALTNELGLNAFVALNTAFSQNGVFIHVAKGTIVDKPIHISNIVVSGGEAIMTLSLIHI